MSEERGCLLQGIAAAMAPYRLPDSWDEDAELIVRYDARSHALRSTPERPDDRDEERIRNEDRRFCDFVASQLREGFSVPLHELVLQAYAQLPGFGDSAGSPPHLAVAGDPHIRILGSVSTIGAGDIATNPAVAKADDVALLNKLEGWRAESGPARDGARRQRRAEMRRTLPARIQQHLRALAADLEDAERRLGLGESWRQAATGTYTRRCPCSPSDAETFTLDVRDFYRWLQQERLLTDSRFAELLYRLRHHVAERIRRALRDGSCAERCASPIAPRRLRCSRAGGSRGSSTVCEIPAR